ncbi:MAG: CDP-alcohol phosphatidyltransferase family protein [Coriobacteriia bacterium]|nr:CDP-alcohol phosphatidyltransferase family protein [Coriobacteriia bacterium]
MESTETTMSRESAHSDHSHEVWTVANIITVLRLLLIPFAFTVLVSDRSNVLAFLLYAAAASTDWLDGQIARRTGTVTEIGKAIDPLVDRLLLASGVIGLYIEQRLPVWVLAVLVSRDIYLLYGAWRLEHYRLRMAVTWTGKWTTAVLLTGFSLLILHWPELPILGGIQLGLVVVYVGVVLSVAAAVQYTFLARSMVRGQGAGGALA